MSYSLRFFVYETVTYGHSLYANGGWYSRLPYPSVWFSSGSNEITEDVCNEQNILGELGYRYAWNRGGMGQTVCIRVGRRLALEE
jgi:hypothetical protein